MLPRPTVAIFTLRMTKLMEWSLFLYDITESLSQLILNTSSPLNLFYKFAYYFNEFESGFLWLEAEDNLTDTNFLTYGSNQMF